MSARNYVVVYDKEEIAPLWERLPDEPILWFRRFCQYLAQQPPRSAYKVYFAEREEKRHQKARKSRERRDCAGKDPKSRIPHAWSHAKQTYRWKERAEAYDWERIFQLVREREALTLQHICAEMADAERMREKGRALLALPQAMEEKESYREQETPDGKVVVHTVFMRATNGRYFDIGVGALKEASMMGRRALGLPTRNRELRISDMTKADLYALNDKIAREFGVDASTYTKGALEEPQRQVFDTQLAADADETDPDLNP